MFLDVCEFLHFRLFLPFLKIFGFWGILGPPYCGIGATIRIVQEMLCLPYAGFFSRSLPYRPFPANPTADTNRHPRSFGIYKQTWAKLGGCFTNLKWVLHFLNSTTQPNQSELLQNGRLCYIQKKSKMLWFVKCCINFAWLGKFFCWLSVIRRGYPL